MSRLIFMLEEISMRELLYGLLPRIIPGTEFLLIVHEGKNDLQSSLKKKLISWQIPEDRFVVVHDKDSADCLKLKQELRDICIYAGREDTLIRIPCHELEAWFLGDLKAVGLTYQINNLAALQEKQQYGNPDHLGSPYQELIRLAPGYQKVSGSRAIAANLSPVENRSHSFKVFIEGVQLIAEQLEK